MKMSKQEDYAIIFMSVLAFRGNCLMSLQEISFEYDIPYYFLKKIARQLKEAKLVKAKEGAAGGYSLAHPAKEINLADIVEAIRGPFNLVECDKGKSCPTDSFCLACDVMNDVTKQVREVFSNVSLTDIIASSPKVNC
jgi:Rrf2 family protein